MSYRSGTATASTALAPPEKNAAEKTFWKNRRRHRFAACATIIKIKQASPSRERPGHSEVSRKKMRHFRGRSSL
jgi:hypothetical protein